MPAKAVFSAAITTVARASQPVKPKVIISAASKVGPCDEFVIDLSSSSRDGGRAWQSVAVSADSVTANVTQETQYT